MAREVFMLGDGYIVIEINFQIRGKHKFYLYQTWNFKSQIHVFISINEVLAVVDFT